MTGEGTTGERPTGLLQDPLREHARVRPGASAVLMGDERLSFGELEALSNRLAWRLRRAGAGPGQRVCLIAPKSPATIAALLATLKTAAAYVPVDTAGPAARAGRIVRAADPVAILVAGAGADLAAELVRSAAVEPKVAILSLPEAGAGEDSGELPAVGGPQDPAHILFTSGSTGEPKGVVITHANVTAFLDWALPHFGLGPGDRVSGHPPLHFDLSTFDVYGSLRAGAELHLVPPRTLLPAQLAWFIAERELTQWFCVPSAMTYMARAGGLPAEGLPTLRRVIWCGEVLPTPVLVEWMRRVPQASYTNLYGPTEATIASSHHTVTAVPGDETAPIPIGTPCAGEGLVILGAAGAALPAGEIGEIAIAGRGLSPGYWRDPEQTAVAFGPDPRPGRTGERLYRTGDLGVLGADGLHYFLGRRDSQIKSRGYRIELGEVESAVNARSEVAECAVVGIDSGGFEGVAICCAYVPRDGLELTAAELRRALDAALPRYMLPSRWQAMAALPKNANGKIDRSRLREWFLVPAESPAST